MSDWQNSSHSQRKRSLCKLTIVFQCFHTKYTHWTHLPKSMTSLVIHTPPATKHYMLAAHFSNANTLLSKLLMQTVWRVLKKWFHYWLKPIESVSAAWNLWLSDLIVNIFSHSTLPLTFNLYSGFQLCRCDSSHGNQAYWDTPTSDRSKTFDRQLWKNRHTLLTFCSLTSVFTPRCIKYTNRLNQKSSTVSTLRHRSKK